MVEYYLYILISIVVVVSVLALVTLAFAFRWLWDNRPFRYHKLSSKFLNEIQELQEEIYKDER